MSRYLRLIAFGAGVLASAGCSSERRLPTDAGPPLAPTGPTAPSPPQPPVISELRPNIGSTGGGTLVVINGTGVGSAVTVTVGGIVSPFEAEWGPDDPIYLSTPAHAAGTVEVIVTDRYGQAASGVFTYASPATFDFNGDWTGYVENLAAWKFAHLELTIRNNIASASRAGSATTVSGRRA